jgi:hypothetical protein
MIETMASLGAAEAREESETGSRAYGINNAARCRGLDRLTAGGFLF